MVAAISISGLYRNKRFEIRMQIVHVFVSGKSGTTPFGNKEGGIFDGRLFRFASGFAPPRSTPPQSQQYGVHTSYEVRELAGKAHFVHV